MDKTASEIKLHKEQLKGVMELDGNNVFSYNLFYPVIDKSNYMANSLKINDFLKEACTQKADKITAFMKKDAKKQKSPFYPTIIKSVVHIPYNKNNIISFVTSYLIQTSPDDFGVSRESYTFDIKEGKLMTLGDVLDERNLSVQGLLFRLSSEIRHKIKNGDRDFLNDWPTNIVRYFNDLNFFLTGDAFAVFYPPSCLKKLNVPSTFYVKDTK